MNARSRTLSAVPTDRHGIAEPGRLESAPVGRLLRIVGDHLHLDDKSSLISPLVPIRAGCREPDLAFAAIARAWDGLEPNLLGLKTDPRLAPIRTDPRYGEWLRKIGFT